MERRVTSHTEEEEMNQRRKLLTSARKGDEKAISKLFELYQVKIYTGDLLKKVKPQISKLPKPSSSASGKVTPSSNQTKVSKKSQPVKKKTKKVVVQKGASTRKKKLPSKVVKKVKPKPKSTAKLKGKSKPNAKLKPKTKPKPKTQRKTTATKKVKKAIPKRKK